MIPIAGPWITDLEVKYAADAARGDWYENAGRYVRRFEEAFAEHAEVPHAIALPHCTSGIHLALAALGVGPGDEVIVPEITWIASAAPISYVGATPVFVDVNARTWCIDAEALRGAITERTKAVISVDLYGGMPNYDAIQGVLGPIPIIEDAAQAVGSEFDGSPAGAMGDIGVFSFHGTKTMVTGEGGMLITYSDEVAERVRAIQNHGRSVEGKAFFNEEIAFKYKMSSVQAALGLAQVERLEDLVEKKRQIFSWYEEELGGEEWITLNHEPEGTRNSYWMTTAITGMRKEELMRGLKERGIDSRPFFYPLSSLPAYRGTHKADAPAAYAISPFGVNLPSALRLEREDVKTVCAALATILG